MIRDVRIVREDRENVKTLLKNRKIENDMLKTISVDYDFEDFNSFSSGFDNHFSKPNTTPVERENDYNYCLVTFNDQGEPDLNGNYYRAMVTIADFDFGTTAEYTTLSFNNSALTDVPTSRISSVRPLTREQYEKCVVAGVHLVI